jgi:NAD(P)-dependent dehydrogenase (short-subunit alcohol dehydrogenase family)
VLEATGAAGRQLLRKLIVGPIVIRPHFDEETEAFEYCGVGAFDGLLHGLIGKSTWALSERLGLGGPDTALTTEGGRVLDVNLNAAFYLARAVVPAMKERRRGSIIAIGGQSSVTNRANTAAVTAAKTGLLGLVRALAAELGPFGIRANMVMPGFIDTERRYAEWYPEFRQSPPGSPDELAKIPLRRLGRPEDIADACVFLASDASAYVTGDSIRVMGGRVIG